MKVGDFVRWKSTIALNNGHLALSNDKGIVVGFSDNKRAARVVWNDGRAGEYVVKALTRTVGDVGGAVADKRGGVAA